MNPIDDQRNFADVLHDWMSRHGLTAYAAAKILPVTAVAIRKWLDGAPCQVERSHRALMTLYDDGHKEMCMSPRPDGVKDDHHGAGGCRIAHGILGAALAKTGDAPRHHERPSDHQQARSCSRKTT